MAALAEGDRGDRPAGDGGTQASTKGMDPAIKAKLLAELRGGPKPTDPREAARKAAAATRRTMLQRGLTDALNRGDQAKAGKYRKALADLPEDGVAVREEGEKIVLETARESAMVPVLQDEQFSTEPATKLGSNDQGLSEDSLESAIAFVGRNARPTGEESFELRQASAAAQRNALIQWAEANGVKLDPSMWEGKASIGGSEHDIWWQHGEIWKVTRPDRFGWTVIPGTDGFPKIAEATPLEYLERWRNANLILGDSARLRGVSVDDHGVQVVISQPYIEGPYPSMPEVRAEMTRRGFDPVPFSIGSESETTFYDDASRTAAFDASSDNFVFADGTPIPVDVIIIRVGDKLRRQLLRLMNLETANRRE